MLDKVTASPRYFHPKIQMTIKDDSRSMLLLVAQTVKNLPAGRRPGFDPWFGKIPWRKEMAIHSSVLAWRIPWTEEPGRLQSMGPQSVGHD